MRKLRHTYWPLGTVLAGTATAFALSGPLAAAVTAPAAIIAVSAVFMFRWKIVRRRLGKSHTLDRGAVLRLSLCLAAPHRFGLCAGDCGCLGFVDTHDDRCAGQGADLLAMIRTWRINLALVSVASAVVIYASLGLPWAIVAAVVAPTIKILWDARHYEGGTYLASLGTYSRAAILSIDTSEAGQA